MEAIIVLAIIGLLLGFVLALADKFLAVEMDERVEMVNDLLPQINCGACGFPGCTGLAEAIVEQSGKVSDCKPLKQDKKDEIYSYLETAEGPNGEKIDLKLVK